MRRDLVRAVRFLVLPTLGLGIVAALVPGRLELAVRIYALVVCAGALLLVVDALRRRYPPARSLRPPERTARNRRWPPPPSLARIEDEVALGVAGAFDLHYRLAPRLRSLASDLLLARRSVVLDADPRTSRRLLGDTTWDLVQPDRPPPDDRLARGLPRAELRGVVETLERCRWS